MTILYPSRPELQAYEAPLGRMMLAYGRAMAAVVALVEAYEGDEAKAVLFIDEVGTDQLPKRVRGLFRGRLETKLFDVLSEALTNFKMIAVKRHYLIHGHWYFDHFKKGQLTIRSARQQKNKKIKIDRLGDVSIRDLDQWADQLDEIADILDDIEFAFRSAR